MTGRSTWRALLGIGAGLSLLWALPGGAAERELEEGPAPSSADEIRTPLMGPLARARKEPRFPWVRQQLQKLPPFFADTQLEGRPRTFYLRKDRTTDELSEAWAAGGSIYYRSGWLRDTFAVEAEGFTSQPLVAPDDRDGTLLLAPGQEGYSVLGLANAQLRYKGVVLTGYRQYLGLPYVNRQDNRMTPNTFEALTLQKLEGRFRFSTGYVWSIKERNADEFISMGETAGATKDRGLAYAAAGWRPDDDFHAGASFGIVPGLLAGAYAEAHRTFALRDEISLRIDAQFSYQDGDERTSQGAFETWNLGVRASTNWQGAVFRLGFSITGDDAGIFNPFGSNPSYVDLMQRTFTQADEKALLVSVSYDFSELGVSGLSAILNFVEAWDGRVLGVRDDARELDLTIDYKIPEGFGFYEGLWLRLRAAWLSEEATDKNGTDVRVILRYDFPVL